MDLPAIIEPKRKQLTLKTFSADIFVTPFKATIKTTVWLDVAILLSRKADENMVLALGLQIIIAVIAYFQTSVSL